MHNQGEVEQNIIEAAKRVFVRKGYDGARMRDIASEANINISMLHYYYRSKDNLFELVFDSMFEEVYNGIFEILGAEMSISEKIEAAVNLYSDTLMQNPTLPNFIFNEITRHPERLSGNKYREKVHSAFEVLQNQADRDEKAGIIRHIDLVELFIDLESRCMFPILNKPLWQNLFSMSEEQYRAMLEKRKKEIISSTIRSLRTNHDK